MQQPKHDEQEEEVQERCIEDAQLYDRYGAAIFAYVRSQQLSREDAEDLTVVVFMAALEHDNLVGLSSKEQLAWLRRVAHNKLVDRVRHMTRYPSVALDQVEEIIHPDAMQDPEYAAQQKEEYRQLHTVIRGLPTIQQQILHLRFSAGLRMFEIAALLNKREATVRKQLSRTLTFLRTHYDDRQQQEGGEKL